MTARIAYGYEGACAGRRGAAAMIAILLVMSGVALADERDADATRSRIALSEDAVGLVAPAAERPSAAPAIAMIERDRADRAVFRRLANASTLEAAKPRRASRPDA